MHHKLQIIKQRRKSFNLELLLPYFLITNYSKAWPSLFLVPLEGPSFSDWVIKTDRNQFR